METNGIIRQSADQVSRIEKSLRDPRRSHPVENSARGNSRFPSAAALAALGASGRVSAAAADPGSRSDPAPFARFDYSSVSEGGWPEGYPNTNLKTGTYRGDRSLGQRTR